MFLGLWGNIRLVKYHWDLDVFRTQEVLKPQSWELLFDSRFPSQHCIRNRSHGTDIVGVRARFQVFKATP
jgi:hypothetical protein